MHKIHINKLCNEVHTTSRLDLIKDWYCFEANIPDKKFDLYIPYTLISKSKAQSLVGKDIILDERDWDNANDLYSLNMVVVLHSFETVKGQS